MWIIREDVRDRRLRNKLITGMDRSGKYDEQSDTMFESKTVQNKMDAVNNAVNDFNDGSESNTIGDDKAV